MSVKTLVSHLFGNDGMSTIGEVIHQKKQADATEAHAKATSEAAVKAYAEAQATAATLESRLKSALAKTGPVHVVDSDGKVEIWMPDVSGVGYHVINPSPVSTPVDLNPPAPVPVLAPAPAPAPVPAPAAQA